MLRTIGLCTAIIFFSFLQQASAHFGMVIADNPIITQDNKSANLTLSFSHPFEGIGMELVKPKSFTVSVNDSSEDLTAALKQTKVMDHTAWTSSYTFKRPGVYQFVMEPTPYWEKAEGVSIIHYTKTIIPAFGEDSGWDTPLNLPVEIVPQLRPFGNYAGNNFSGQVLADGKPVANAEVEVEMYNSDNAVTAPSDYHITQVVKADANGIFHFTCPLAGWWGFAALIEADYTINNPAGEAMPVELGGVTWVYFDAIQESHKK